MRCPAYTRFFAGEVGCKMIENRSGRLYKNREISSFAGIPVHRFISVAVRSYFWNSARLDRIVRFAKNFDKGSAIEHICEDASDPPP